MGQGPAEGQRLASTAAPLGTPGRWEPTCLAVPRAGSSIDLESGPDLRRAVNARDLPGCGVACIKVLGGFIKH